MVSYLLSKNMLRDENNQERVIYHMPKASGVGIVNRANLNIFLLNFAGISMCICGISILFYRFGPNKAFLFFFTKKK